MNATAYEKVEDNPRFQELVRKRSRFSWLLSAITLVLYVGFIFLSLLTQAGLEHQYPKVHT